MKVRRMESTKRSSLSTLNIFSLIHLLSFPLFANVLVVFVFCVCKVLLEAPLVPIAMPINCWKTCSSTYTNANSSTKSLRKIVKSISPKLTDYCIEMGRKKVNAYVVVHQQTRKMGNGSVVVCQYTKTIGKEVYRSSIQAR